LVAVFLICLVVVGLGVLGVVGLGRLAGSRSTPEVAEPPTPTPAPIEATASVGTEPVESTVPEEEAAVAAPTTVPSRTATPRATPRPTPRTSPTAPPERSAASTSSEDVTPPRKLSGDSVKLPRGTKLPATVLAEFFVLEDGSVSEPQVVESGGETLDAACLKALLTWRYQPAMKGDVAVKHRQQFRFTFRGR
jgi:TonB family protein